MENYQMNRSCGRPYQTTCGMGRPQMRERMPERSFARSRQESSCNCHMPGVTPKEAALYEHIDQMPPTMAYVPCQKYMEPYDLCYALQVGTIFPNLCKPFCGKRGGCR